MVVRRAVFSFNLPPGGMTELVNHPGERNVNLVRVCQVFVRSRRGNQSISSFYLVTFCGSFYSLGVAYVNQVGPKKQVRRAPRTQPGTARFRRKKGAEWGSVRSFQQALAPRKPNHQNFLQKPPCLVSPRLLQSNRSKLVLYSFEVGLQW